MQIGSDLWLYCADKENLEVKKLIAKFKLSGSVDRIDGKAIVSDFCKRNKMDILISGNMVCIYDKKAQDEFLDSNARNINLTAAKLGLHYMYFKGYKDIFSLQFMLSSCRMFDGGVEELKDLDIRYIYYDVDENKVYAVCSGMFMLIIGDNLLEVKEYDKSFLESKNTIMYKHILRG
jgi:hypothetical protein